MKTIATILILILSFSLIAEDKIKFMDTTEMNNDFFEYLMEQEIDEAYRIEILEVKHNVGMHLYNVIATPISLGFATMGFRTMIMSLNDGSEEIIFKCRLITDPVLDTLSVSFCKSEHGRYKLDEMKFTYEELGIDLEHKLLQ